ncbi:MAG: translocation/assembly module TamB domain-containing protein, partial [Ostreibacterium sp.]
GIKNLDITGKSNGQHYQAQGGVYLYADNIPPIDIKLIVNGDSTRLDKAELLVKSLGGLSTVTASGLLSPLDLTANVTAKKIQPQLFYPNVEGNINSNMSFSAKQQGKNIMAVAVINSLTGQLQKKPLSGIGTVIFDQAKEVLNISGLAINLAGNKVNANGQLSFDTSQGKSNLVTKIDAKYLKRLLPGLSGALVADIIAKGNLTQPTLAAKISGNNLSYQGYGLKQLKASADVSLSNDKINFKAKAIGLNVGDVAISSADVGVSGKISNHQLTLSVKTPPEMMIPNVRLMGRGGFNSKKKRWKGQLSQLNLSNALAGVWTMPKPTALILSGEQVSIDKFCLQQKMTRLCADGSLTNQTGQFDVLIKGLKTKDYAALFPKNIKLDTRIDGQAVIKLIRGKPAIKGKLVASNGELSVLAEKGAFTSKIKQLETIFSFNNNRLENITAARLSKLGSANIEVVMPNVTRPNINVKAGINSDNLAFLEELIPQLSDVKGKLSGNMTLSGNPAKQLNVAGKIILHKTDLDVPQFGTRIRGLTLDIFAKNGNQIGFKGGANAGQGQLTISGNLNPATQRGEVVIKGQDFQVADSKTLKVTINPDLRLLLADNIQVRGEITIPKALIVPSSLSETQITASEDVVLPGKVVKKQSASSPIDVAVAVKLGDDVRVASADIETRLLGGIKLIARPGEAMTANGSISVETGALRVYGQQLEIERGRVIFGNGPMTNPALDMRASREIEGEDVTVGVNVLGDTQKPEISLFSTPSMPDSSILSYLIFGKPPSSGSLGSAVLLQTGGLVGVNSIAKDIRSSVGLDVLDFTISGVEAGKNLTKKIYMGVRTNFFESINEFLLKYKISGSTYLDATMGTNGVSSDLIKEIETD